ncbi:unnamed protein product [Trichogramma brassicae]|uniref:Uncharacterized protein n=1 Tax=Trichogramma brassicae TaxID=86971 RepID=A0A6H5JBD4_9HYME|nr:unnamed protein product [Trichogramma brassicae]
MHLCARFEVIDSLVRAFSIKYPARTPLCRCRGRTQRRAVMRLATTTTAAATTSARARLFGRMYRTYRKDSRSIGCHYYQAVHRADGRRSTSNNRRISKKPREKESEEVAARRSLLEIFRYGISLLSRVAMQNRWRRARARANVPIFSSLAHLLDEMQKILNETTTTTMLGPLVRKIAT